ncbi:uncharacterized protein C2845_PM11G18540 [Panicum miliaceum]|uniref:Protein Lines C-terminal domain-containing protein n=1 Tax=Panicum miliaceum TaxID=4540 RepID=A0A3L6RTA5_PANMI|nr:uncharacterized protein C2845_PM11G18540 [Panicum miliaceum]
MEDCLTGDVADASSPWLTQLSVLHHIRSKIRANAWSTAKAEALMTYPLDHRCSLLLIPSSSSDTTASRLETIELNQGLRVPGAAIHSLFTHARKLLHVLEKAIVAVYQLDKQPYDGFGCLENTVFVLVGVLGFCGDYVKHSAGNILLHYDHMVLVDYLISKDVGVHCAQYLLRCLRLVSQSWHAFVDDSIYLTKIEKLDCKRQRTSRDINSAGASSSKEAKNSQKLFLDAKVCLYSLKRTVEDLQKEGLFPYNPKPLLRSLARFEQLCEQG